MKKPFKETKLGKWLSNNAPKIGNVVADVLPDKGILGVVKNLIDSDNELTPEVKLEFEKMQHEFEMDFLQIEVEDKKSARIRETEFVKATGHIDWMMTITGASILISFIGVLGVICFVEVPTKNEHLIINAIGVIEGLVGLVVGYYFGSSAGSRIKDTKKGE